MSPTSAAPSERPAVPAPPPFDWRRSAGHGAWILGFGLLMAWAWNGARIAPGELVANFGNSMVFAADFVRPDFSAWRDYLEQMIVTLHMALWGSFLAILAAIPLSLMSAANLSPWWLRQPVRRGLDALRAINEMVFAFIFMVAVGLGPFAGTLALFVHTTGVLGKLFSEAIEGIDPRPVEGIRATGANWLEEIVWGVIPQVLPMWTSYALYRFESNVRSATVVGLVGAGGIGYVLNEHFRIYDYGKVSAIVLMIVATVTVIDLVSSRLRQKAI
jgi:phosphonate transport system permease protein